MAVLVNGWLDRRLTVTQQGSQIFDGLDEVELLSLHHEVNGVEVRFTMEAASQVGFSFDRR